MFRFFVVLLVLLGIGLAGLLVWNIRNSKLQNADQQINWVKAERGKIRASVTSSGRIVSNLDVDIKCKASGPVVKLAFDISESVKKDALLAELDPIDEQRNVKQASVALEASKAKLETSKQTLVVAEQTLQTDRERMEQTIAGARARSVRSRSRAERLKQLIAQNYSATSQEEYDAAEALAQVDEADLKNAEVRRGELKTEEAALQIKRSEVRLAETEVEADAIALDVANQRLTDTKVYSPMDAVVSARPVQVGQIISSAISNVGGGTTLLTLSDISKLFTLASVDESDIGRVKLGMPCDISADAYPGIHFKGAVVRIAPKGVSVNNVVTVEVKIEITDERKNLLMPEMTTNLEIISSEKENVIKIPVDAVTKKQGVLTVQVSTGEKNGEKLSEDRKVETGINDGLNIEVLSGVSEGEQVGVRKSDVDSRWKAPPEKTPMGKK